jgi:PilZ domain
MFLTRVFKHDRRRWPRQWFNTSVQVFKESAQMDARGVTLSSGGMSLITLSNLPLGSRVDVEFMPPSSEEIVRLPGTVRSRALYLYGIEFLASSEHRQRFARTYAGA